MKAAKWNVQTAVDNYYNDGGNQSVANLSNEMTTAFDKYKKVGIDEGGDESLDAIQGDGLMQLLTDLDIDPTSVNALVFCWKMNMKVAFTLSRSEWTDCLSDHSIKSMQQLKQKASKDWPSELSNATSFKQFYLFVFEYSKEVGSRSLPVDVAVPTWQVILQGKYVHLDKWCQFVETEFNKAIPRDLWALFLDFTRTYPADVKSYEDDGAWPSAIDSFVEYLRK